MQDTKVNTGYSLDQDNRTLNLEDANPEKIFMNGYTDDKKKILGKDNSRGLFSPDIVNPLVISKVMDSGKTLGETSKERIDTQKLPSQTEVKDYLHEWGVKMHKRTEDIAYDSLVIDGNFS